MKEKEIIEKLNSVTQSVELPQKPVQNVVREMRKGKAKVKKPFYMRKSFVAACACLLIAVVLIPTSMIVFNGAKSYESYPSASYKNKPGDVANYPPEFSSFLYASNVEMMSSEELENRTGITLPESLDGERAECSAYSLYDGGDILGANAYYGNEATVSVTRNAYITDESDKVLECDGIVVNVLQSETEDSVTECVFNLNEWWYMLLYKGPLEDALAFIKLFG